MNPCTDWLCMVAHYGHGVQAMVLFQYGAGWAHPWDATKSWMNLNHGVDFLWSGLNDAGWTSFRLWDGTGSLVHV